MTTTTSPTSFTDPMATYASTETEVRIKVVGWSKATYMDEKYGEMRTSMSFGAWADTPEGERYARRALEEQRAINLSIWGEEVWEWTLVRETTVKTYTVTKTAIPA